MSGFSISRKQWSTPRYSADSASTTYRTERFALGSLLPWHTTSTSTSPGGVAPSPPSSSAAETRLRTMSTIVGCMLMALDTTNLVPGAPACILMASVTAAFDLRPG